MTSLPNFPNDLTEISPKIWVDDFFNFCNESPVRINVKEEGLYDIKYFPILNSISPSLGLALVKQHFDTNRNQPPSNPVIKFFAYGDGEDWLRLKLQLAEKYHSKSLRNHDKTY